MCVFIHFSFNIHTEKVIILCIYLEKPPVHLGHSIEVYYSCILSSQVLQCGLAALCFQCAPGLLLCSPRKRGLKMTQITTRCDLQSANRSQWKSIRVEGEKEKQKTKNKLTEKTPIRGRVMADGIPVSPERIKNYLSFLWPITKDKHPFGFLGIRQVQVL